MFEGRVGASEAIERRSLDVCHRRFGLGFGFGAFLPLAFGPRPFGLAADGAFGAEDAAAASFRGARTFNSPVSAVKVARTAAICSLVGLRFYSFREVDSKIMSFKL